MNAKMKAVLLRVSQNFKFWDILIYFAVLTIPRSKSPATLHTHIKTPLRTPNSLIMPRELPEIWPNEISWPCHFDLNF